MRTLTTTMVCAAALVFLGCASTPESRLRDEVYLDVYWVASHECEGRYATLHVDRIGLDGSLGISAAANSRSEAAPFRDCYWRGIEKQVDRRRAAGLAVPEAMNLKPDIEID
jgi:hypothetical protein